MFEANAPVTQVTLAMPKAAGRSFRGVQMFTIGHSTRTLEELVACLRAHDISVLVDIRTIARSRHNPQFNEDVLRAALRSRRLRYVHLTELGGLRHARKDSPNMGWRNASFRGYADYMLTPEFESGLEKLRALAESGRVALMCAEAVPWRCHRSLVADVVTVRSGRVEHITSQARALPHHLTTFAQVDGAHVLYPGESAGELATGAPFHLEATVRVLQRRPTNLIDVWQSASYRRVLASPEGLVLVELTNAGSIDQPDLRMRLLEGALSARARADVQRTLRKVLGLDVDPLPLQQLVEHEPKLGACGAGLRGMRPPRFAGLFETFANVVPFQQVSLDAGVAIVRRLVMRFGEQLEHDGQRFYAFPEASVIAEARLDAIKASGLSRRKAEALRGLGRAIAAGELTEEKLASLSTVEAKRLLTELSGIGPWSASLVLLRGLGRLEVFPPGDVGAAKGLAKVLHVPAGRSLERVIERLGDQRGYVYFCALGTSLQAQGLIQPG